MVTAAVSYFSFLFCWTYLTYNFWTMHFCLLFSFSWFQLYMGYLDGTQKGVLHKAVVPFTMAGFNVLTIDLRNHGKHSKKLRIIICKFCQICQLLTRSRCRFSNYNIKEWRFSLVAKFYLWVVEIRVRFPEAPAFFFFFFFVNLNNRIFCNILLFRK
jgi:hypothetical protein